VGNIVYPRGSPQSAGVVTHVYDQAQTDERYLKYQYYRYRVTIIQRSGKEVIIKYWEFYSPYVEKHRQRFEKHNERLLDLQELADNL